MLRPGINTYETIASKNPRLVSVINRAVYGDHTNQDSGILPPANTTAVALVPTRSHAPSLRTAFEKNPLKPLTMAAAGFQPSALPPHLATVVRETLASSTTSPAVSTPQPAKKPNEGLEGEAKWKAEFAADAKLRDEFSSEGSYLAYKRGEAAGRVRIVRSGAVRVPRD
jgi:hypothetical protein